MTRYQVLRSVGCEPLTAAIIALANWVYGAPAGLVVCLNVQIEYGIEGDGLGQKAEVST